MDKENGNKRRFNALLFGAASPAWKEILGLVAMTALYWFSVYLGLRMVTKPEGFSPLWPASGVMLAFLLIRPKQQWGTLLGLLFAINTLGNLSGGSPLLVSAGFALANLLVVVSGAWFMTTFCQPKISFGRTCPVFALLIIVLLVNGLTSLLAASISAMAFHSPFFNDWLLWLAADGLGIALVTPFIISWIESAQKARSFSISHSMEMLALFSLLAVFAWLLFGPFTNADEPLLRNYMIFPLLIWLAFRSSPRGMTSAFLLVASIALWFTYRGVGIFGYADQTRIERLVSLQIFLAVMVFSGLILIAVVSERKHAENLLRDSQELLSKFIKHSPIFAFIKAVTPTESRVLQASDNFAEMIGIPGVKMTGKSMPELFPPEFADKMTADDWTVVANGQVLKLEEDLNDRHYTTFKYPIIQGGKTLLAGYTIDITERKRAEQALAEANLVLQNALARVQELARIDPLTGIFNRRCLFEMAEHEVTVALRYNQPLSMLMFDIDHFKTINDTFGHTVGDQILKTVIQAIRLELRTADVFGRYGGEEFVVVLPMTSVDHAYAMAERIRRVAAGVQIPTPKGDASITVSIGVVEINPPAETLEDLLRRADEAMYIAKQAGRNRTMIGENA